MADFSRLNTIADKLATDISAHLAADSVLKGQLDDAKAANATLTTENADLKAELAVFEGAQANIDALADKLIAADNAIAPAA